MFITVTLNPAIDTFIEIESLETKEQSRLISKKKIAGGKGINISRVLKKLNEKTFVTGFIGGDNGKFISKQLSYEQIDSQLIKIDQETRENFKLYDRFHKQSYEINAPGPVVDISYLDELIVFLKSIIKKNDVLIISGSAPVNYNVDVYKILINEMKPLCKMISLDTSKQWFKEGISAIPDLIKPNLSELENYLDKQLTSEEDIIKEALDIISLGVKEVLVSLGKNGSIYVSKDFIYKITVPNIKVKQTVGAGDALLAGFISAKFKKTLEEALIDAAFTSLSYISESEDISDMKSKIKIRKISI
jgi:1-phosphofructokinase